MFAASSDAPTVIAGVDGFAPSPEAVAFAARLASHDGTLVLACVYPYAPFPGRATDPEFHAELHAQARQALERMRAVAEGAGVVTPVLLDDPSPARALHELAVERHAAAIVLGSSHVGRLSRTVLGSTADRLLHGAPCPVVVVPRGAHPGSGRLARIGVAVDGSPESLVALHSAAAVARAHDAELHVIAVCDAYRYGAPAAQNGPGFFIDRDERDRLARERLDAAVAQVSDQVRAVPVMRTGAPTAEIVAASANLDLLVMGSRGYGPLHAVLVGGVSGRVVRDATCPVLVTPRGAGVEAGTTAVATAEHA